MGNESTSDTFQVCNQCRIKKIRCDREKPSCGNCVRNGQCCEWSGQGKKRNQITQLSRTISGMNGRLQEVEAAVLDIHRSLTRTRTASSSSSPVFPSSRASDAETLSLRTGELPTLDNGNTPTRCFTRPMGRLVEDRRHIPGAVYYGPTSLETLMLNFEDSVSTSIASNIQGPGNTSLSIHDRIQDFVDTGQHKSLSGAASALTEPPLVILEGMIEPYFSNINPQFPIWSRDRFQDIVTSLRQHSTRSEVEWASVVCCNNLILIQLTTDSAHSVQRKMAQSGSRENTPSMGSDLVAGFLANSKRAIENLGPLSPSLVNLQALLSLCVVARDHLPLHILDFIFVQAIRCAEAIGIFQWHHLRGQLCESDFRDYKNVAHCLYILDKQICWTAGVSPRLLASKVQLDLAPADETFKTLAVKAELAAIEETIFLQVYADHVPDRTEDQVRDLVGSIVLRLDDWLHKSGVDVEAVIERPSSCTLHAAMVFGSACAKLLLIRPLREHSDALFKQHSGIALTCMKILVSLWAFAPGTGQQASLPLLLASYPPVYLLEIYSSTLNGTASESDKDLLRSFSGLLEAIVGLRQDLFYVRRLKEVSLILAEAVAAPGIESKRRRTTLSMECLSRPSSSCHAFWDQNPSKPVGMNNTDHLYAHSGNLELDHQYSLASGFVFPEWDDSAYEHMGIDEDHNQQLFECLVSQES